MHAIRFGIIGGIAAAQIFLAAVAIGQAVDVFSFIPLGGRDLLARVLQSQPAAAEARAILAGKRTREEWESYLKDRGAALKAVQTLGDTERKTLADYLAFNMPLPPAQIPSDLGRANWSRDLPLDGRDFMMERCQGCHIITVVVTQARTKEAWLGTMGKPSHIRIKLTPQQREALANYLVLNAGIPIDQVPEELRAGGASY
jgi:hypothetical protein